MFLRTILKNYLILFLLVFSFYTSFSYSDDQKIKTLNQLGSNEAKNTLVEYASLSCVHCANFHNNEFLKIKTNFIDTGKLKFIYKDFPLDRPAMYASLVNHCFSGEQYFEVLSSLYRNQRKWVSVSNNSGKFYGALHDTLKVHGIKLEKVIECVDDKSEANKDKWNGILASRLEGQNSGVNSTPTFFLNGKKIEEPLSYEVLKNLIK